MPSTRQLTLLSPDGTPLQDHVLGMGRTGVVVQRDGTALKLPLQYRTAGANEESPIEEFKASADISCESLRREKDVYERLGQHHGIVPCLDLSGDGIQMEFMANGNLLHYLAQHRRPSQDMQRTWFQEMARTLVHIHDHRVIVADIATRNFLLDSELSVKFSDFAESSILPLDTETADDGGFSIYTDIGQFGAVLYEVVTGQMCEFDLFKDLPPGPATAVWPRRQDLPSTEIVWLGSVIEKCWTKGAYQNARELLTALERACDARSN